jgi:hypothetical protein
LWLSDGSTIEVMRTLSNYADHPNGRRHSHDLGCEKPSCQSRQYLLNREQHFNKPVARSEFRKLAAREAIAQGLKKSS